MMFGILGRTGVFYEHKGKAEAGALTGSGFDAYVGGDAGEDDGVDATGFELLLEVCAGEGAPVAFGEEDVAGLETGGGSDLRCGGGQGLVAKVLRLVDGEFHEVI